ncbi:hypothetical protein [Bradyrhizobium sp. CCGUVB14]|uniref:hypothetical protein n=1 Tax=Bradyrhizobium sp. CCGUVB14 TaxID=2949628 RepID=UPI0020B29B52|nr:hypothetical protein [Bradyrhizobium sp. CCGUVB14]MCP3445139.1 hypothetical protein [Bradyrhizobium sp. CCGUVB14]
MSTLLIRLGLLLVISLLSATASAQSPIPLSYFGMHILSDSNPWPALPIGSRRMIVNANWWDISAGPGQYDWTAFDAIVARSTTSGADVVFDLGGSPAWASSNPSAGPCAWGFNGNCVAPQTQYWAAWISAAVTHAACRVKFWEIWNEPNDGGFWRGDIPTMVALARQAYQTIKSIDPTAKVLTPAVYSDPTGGTIATDGVAWMMEFLRQCSVPPAGSTTAPPCADILAYHGYPVNWAELGDQTLMSQRTIQTGEGNIYLGVIDPASYPLLGEQAIIDIQKYKNIASTYGLEAVWSTEGGLGVWLKNNYGIDGQLPSCQAVDCLTNPIYLQNRQLSAEYVVKTTMLMQAGGLARSYWYAYDNIALGYLWGGQGTSLNGTGTAYALLGQLVGTTPATPVARQATTNRISNPSASGAMVGSPGAAPTSWRVIAADGLAINVVNVAGDAVDFRIQGTPTTTRTFARIEFETPGTIASVQGTQWFGGFNQSLIEGSYNNVTVWTGLVEYNGSQQPITFTSGQNAPATSLDYALQHNPIMAITKSPYCAFVVPTVAFGYSAGQPVDVTLRLARPSIDNGTTWQGTYTRADGSSVILAWDSSGNPTVLPLSPGYSRYQDVSGSITTITGNQVTLTNSPIFILKP